MASNDVTIMGKCGNLQSRENTRARETFVKPSVDIFETEDGLTLVADLPGVGKEDLTIDIDKGILSLKGTPGSAGAGERIYREYELASYYRQFELPDEVDLDKVAADLKDGVLTLMLPKAEAAKPRRIEVATH